VVLHPTSIFAYDPDILQPPDDGVVEGKLRYSTRHQLLAYVNLFETNKAYFMNCMRVPALQTLLLYARSLDTNAECTRILCDSWLEIRFLDVIIAQKIISAIISLRTSIDKLFKIRLEERSKLFVNLNDKDNDEELEFSSISETKRRKERAKILENILKKKLTEFLDSSVLYSLRRVLPAELNTIYIKNYVTDTNQNIGDEKLFKQLSATSNNLEPKINESKGIKIVE
jgi:ATP-dependent RNA helicase DHX34